MTQPLLYIVRHGATGDDENYNSPENPNLNEAGRKDAQDLVRFFRGRKIGNVYTSAMKRATETADILTKEMGNKKPISKKSLDSLDIGHVASIADSDVADRVIHYHQKNPHIPIPGGESLAQLGTRVRPEFEEAINRFKQTGEPDVFVVHHSIQHEAGKYFNGDKDSALTEPGGVVAVYSDGRGGLMAQPIYKESDVGSQVEKELSNRGIDPEKFEEVISPGIHARMAATLGNNMKKHKFSHTVVEHHSDGSHTVHHIHEKHGHAHAVPKRDGDVKGSAGDHDQMIDHLMDHTSEMNPGEGHDESNQPIAQAAPPPVAPPAGV